MTDRFQDRLSEFLDGELPPEERLLVERHLETCGDCAETLEQLDAVRTHARDLPCREPGDEIWAGISTRIREIEREGQPGAATPLETRRAKRLGRIAFTVPQLAAAAVTLAAVSASSAWWVGSRGTGVAGGRPGVTNPVALPASNTGEAPSSAARGAETIEALERALFERDLPPQSRARIERALTTIDRAIEDARAALRMAPGDPYLEEHVTSTMDRKAEFLSRTLRLTSQS